MQDSKAAATVCVHNAIELLQSCSAMVLLRYTPLLPHVVELTHDRCKRISLYILACHFRNVSAPKQTGQAKAIAQVSAMTAYTFLGR